MLTTLLLTVWLYSKSILSKETSLMEFHHCIISTCTLYAIASLLRYFFWHHIIYMCGDVLCVQSLRFLAFLEMDQVFKEATTFFMGISENHTIFMYKSFMKQRMWQHIFIWLCFHKYCFSIIQVLLQDYTFDELILAVGWLAKIIFYFCWEVS